MHHHFKAQWLLCAPPCVHYADRDNSMCFALISEQRRNISLYSLNRLTFTIERVWRTGCINIILINLHPNILIYITWIVMYGKKIGISWLGYLNTGIKWRCMSCSGQTNDQAVWCEEEDLWDGMPCSLVEVYWTFRQKNLLLRTWVYAVSFELRLICNGLKGFAFWKSVNFKINKQFPQVTDDVLRTLCRRNLSILYLQQEQEFNKRPIPFLYD